MLISKVPDNEGGKGEGHEIPGDENHSHEYQTANELFELMANNKCFGTGDVDTLTTRDLVLLYKNIDLGTKLMSNANELRRKRPNQYVETIVYNDEPESDGSDVSDIYSSEDLHNVFLVNKERIDLLNTPPSVENTLCHKFGDLDIQFQSSDLTTEYDKHFLFKDPYIKEQLNSLKLMSSTEIEGTVLPASLLDYICCKRLEDNYTFYMDNIIRYVRHTIEQLKRISNGDYLTDKAKEKWREVENAADDHCRNNTKVLATSTSIPLHVEQKIGGQKSTWDDIVHSAVDIRSLSKILEKKIVVEVPKLLCGSYKLLSKCCAENLIISCKKDKRPAEEPNLGSRVDVVFQLKRSETGQVMSNISSIMILKNAPAIQCDTVRAEIPSPLPLEYDETTNETVESNVKIIEIEQIDVNETFKERSLDSDDGDKPNEDTFLDSIDYVGSDNDDTASIKNSSYQESTESGDAIRDILDKKLMYAQRESPRDVVFPDDLRLTIQKLTMQSALTEESGEDISQSTGLKKKSPSRVRIKSPYENQSYIMEEKKRRKLLEIRERRERKKMALAENCKITKHKYGKGAVMPQSASSVTKLSISNKSFYDSIYGQTTNVDPKSTKGRNRKGGKRDVIDVALEGLGGEHDVSIVTPERNSKKYINRSYYLDDAVTEMMYMNMKRSENEGKDLCSTSTSVISNDFRNNLNLLSQLIGPSETEFIIANDEISAEDKTQLLLSASRVDGSNDGSPLKVLTTSQSILNMVPSNSPNIEGRDKNDPKKVVSSVECRKSIDKIYTLMKKFGKCPDTESKSSKSKNAANKSEKNDGGRGSSTIQGSDSGTSLKHHVPSSNPSCFSFEKNNVEILQHNNTDNQNPESPTAIVPKVIISSKSSLQTQKTDLEKNKKDRRRPIASPTLKVPENPLKAISQLLHEFDNVQKNRPKPVTEHKQLKKSEMMSSDGRSGSRQSSFKRRSRLDQHNEAQTEKCAKVMTSKEKKNKPFPSSDIPKIPYQHSPLDEKHLDRIPKKKIIDILDEAKEARGEAVRGPSKLNSRLNSLAQPKRSYVQAHSEEYQTKYGRTVMADRLQKLAAAPPPCMLDRNTGSANSRNKIKRSGTEAVSAVSVKQPPASVPPLDRATRTRHSTSSSPETKERLSHGVGPSYKQITVPETPETLKKKRVAVESYVKNHFGRATSTTLVIEPQSAQKSRVPLVPNDIELASSTSSPTAEESTELGSRLHNIISTIIKTTSQGLEVLPECQESNSKLSKITNECSQAENSSGSERMSSDSDYTVDILDDQNVLTTVENIDETFKMEQVPINEEEDAATYNLQLFKSTTELEMLEHALCRHIPVGTFPKRLRIKNLTITPKQSTQQVFVLQSGDASSLVVKAPIAQSLNDTTADNFSDIKAMPILSKSHLDWHFADFPMQISTVGYAFPEYKSIQCGSNSLVKLFDEVSKSSEEKALLVTSCKTDRDIQCFKGGQPQPRLEQAAQVDVPALVSIAISSTQIIDLEKEIKQCDETISEPKHVFIDFSENKTIEKTLNDDKAQKNVLDEKKESVPPAENLDDIEYSTSLDILVGLLNEIQKITTCQTQITNSDKNHNENQESKELETILNKAAALESSIKSSPCDIISFTSLDRLRQLDSNQSLYSFYLSDHEGSERASNKINVPSVVIPQNNELLRPKPISADKEVSADFVEKEYVNRFTDVPSQIFPISINHGTTVTNSLIGMLSEPSTQSMFSFAEYHSVYSNVSSISPKNIIEIPQMISTTESNQALALCEVNQAMKKANENNIFAKKIQCYGNNKNVKANKDKYRLKSDFDPIMKMKRDILVTVYSILVFTVFAALSFPEMFYNF